VIKIGERTFKNIEQWQIDYITKNYTKKFTEIASEINMDYRRVGEIINLLGIKRDRHWKVYLPKNKEVEEKLRNPFLSHVEIAQEYGVSDSCVAMRRKNLGINVRRKNFDTLIEKEVAKILDDLDLVYGQQKRIDKWSIDFYLGRKHCIDVHGNWSHNLDKAKDRDIRKTKFLKENNFSYLVIYEDELSNLKKVRKKIEEFVLGFPHS
jgi:very-short-patch-repair endonuclease